jgi:transcriptional regulator with XRE-family HTH domain
MKIINGKTALHRRVSLGMNQTEFWERVGSSQSAGSRYEKGRTVPGPVLQLLELAYTGEKRERDRALRQLRNWDSA